VNDRLFKQGLGLAISLPILAACSTRAGRFVLVTATPGAAPTVTASPTPTAGPATCADLDAAWGDWPSAINVLERLIAAGQSCGPEPLASKLYAAHFNFAAALEAQGNSERAIKQYRGAVRLDPRREDALKALVRLNGLPTPTLSPCAPIEPGLADEATPTPVDPGQFVSASGDRLVLGGQPYRIRGVNYYPRHAPWERFLEQSDPQEMAGELDLIEKAGFNTIRIFLWYQPLFTCSGGATIPEAAPFKKVDKLMSMASKRGLKVIVTLNDLPDLYINLLYAGDTYVDAETAYIVRRYRASPALLAWDLRNEGDLDYVSRHGAQPRSTRQQVLSWLQQTSQIVRQNDAHHLITAGWAGDPTETDPYVDVLSFHYWSSADPLDVRIKGYRQLSTKPILLEEFGYAYQGVGDGDNQAALIGQLARRAEEQGLAGWMVWTAFDFQPPPGQAANYEDYFGLWTVDLAPKAALKALPLP
jgi:tetratricopeptide (TPR) repeat protein